MSSRNMYLYNAYIYTYILFYLTKNNKLNVFVIMASCVNGWELNSGMPHLCRHGTSSGSHFIKNLATNHRCDSMLKGLLHRKVYKLTRNPMNGVCQQDQLSWNGINSGDDNRRVKQTMLHYFKRVAIFRDKHFPNRSIGDTLGICYFNISISWKQHVFYCNGSTHVISFKKGWLLKFH